MPPNIPTSFVPRQPVKTGSVRGLAFNFQGLFLIISFIVLALAVLASLGVFVYGQYLDGQSTAKAAELTKEEQNISQSTVEEFLRLQNRLSSSEGLLDRHVTLSTFFNLFESLTLTHVQFTSLKITVADDQSAKLEAAGKASSFNALAAESKSFSAAQGVKDAIFSDFTTDKSGNVGFSLTATLDPSLVADFSAAVQQTTGTTPPAPAAAVSTSTPSQPAATTTP
jgi:hypothetical protein